MGRNVEGESARLDDAARAGWLYYVAGNTQDEIARKLGISRQTAQRLVSLAMSERLIKVRLDHPIARCMELSSALRQRYDLHLCEVSPSDPTSASSTLGIAQIAAAEMERWLRRPDPIVIGIGTGRTMRAVADQLPPMQCPQHRLVALVGTGKVDGSASFYDVIIRVSDSVRAPHYPMPLPVIARSLEERDLFMSLPSSAQRARTRRPGRRDFRRRRFARREFGAAHGRFPSPPRRTRRCAAPARWARSPAGRSIRTGVC